MNIKIFIAVFLFFLSFKSHSQVNKKEERNPKIEIHQHFTSSKVILDWFNDGMTDDGINKIIALPGIQIMESNVILAHDQGDKILSFKDELNLFKDSPQNYSGIFGLDLAFREKENTSALLNKIQTSSLDVSVIKRAFQYFPDDFNINTSADIYYVLTGWKWGDAYVRPVENVNGNYKISPQGKSSIIFNLSLFANRYGDDIEKQFLKISNVMSHELFHFIFSDFKQQSENYKKLNDDDFLLHLLDIVQNEGIGHYVDRQNDLKSDFSKYQIHQHDNFNKLNEVLLKLSSEDISTKEKQKLVRNSNVGKYWSKYGAITGMFMAYHIDQLLGKEAITKTIKEGSLHFISTYMELQKVHKELPWLEFNVKSFDTE